MLVESVIKNCGLRESRFRRVHGGDINEAYCIESDGGKYFLKINATAECPGMFEKEAKGLNALRNNCALAIPQILKLGQVEQKQYLLLEWMEAGNAGAGSWEDFGMGLAALHRQHQKYFGWEEDNYIATLPQNNSKADTWHMFYSERRILPFTKRLYSSGILSQKDVKEVETVCRKLENLFPAEKPALLHGDLWSGNFMFAEGGKACIFDPAVYFGHREMDLGMSLLFGGFGKSFYEAYNQTYPLEKGWTNRVPLAQLYPLLVHAALFGGNYVHSARENWRKYI